MQSRAVEGVGMPIGKRAAARGSAGDAEEAGTRLSQIESKKRKSDFSREADRLQDSPRAKTTSLSLVLRLQALYRSLSDRITQNDRHHAIQQPPGPLEKWDSNFFLWTLAVAVTEHR